jgi:hypothetical protein
MISDKRAPLLRDGSWFSPRPRWRPGTLFEDLNLRRKSTNPKVDYFEPGDVQSY